MKLYRGQRYGDAVGQWWTTDLEDARSYARSRGRNRAWVVFVIEVDGRSLWARRHLYDRHPHTNRGTYRIPPAVVREHFATAVRIVDGFVEIAQ